MAARFVRLPLLAQTAYARLVDLLLASDAGDVAQGATLVSKSIRGHRYWYVQRVEGGKKTQTYLGKETPEVLAVVEKWRQARADAGNRAELVAMARAGRALVVSAAEAKVFELLAGVFKLGACLVGSHALAVLGNMLGVRWQEAIVRTDDVDIAHDHRIAVALAEGADPVKVPEVLGATPLFSMLKPTTPPTSFRVRGSQIEVDLLTPLIGNDRRRAIEIPALGAAAIPLRFLDFLIEETQPAVVLGGSGVLVNVPRPGRFALHKLLVASRRGTALTKANKDREQASALFEVLVEDLPGEITLAWKALEGRGSAWTRGVRASLVKLDPPLVERLAALGIKPKA
jgi:hypothetical protein